MNAARRMPDVVDAVVLVEARVLDRDRRVLERLRDLAVGDRLAQVAGLDDAEAPAVAVEDDREAARVARLQRRPAAAPRRRSRPRSRPPRGPPMAASTMTTAPAMNTLLRGLERWRRRRRLRVERLMAGVRTERPSVVLRLSRDSPTGRGNRPCACRRARHAARSSASRRGPVRRRDRRRRDRQPDALRRRLGDVAVTPCARRRAARARGRVGVRGDPDRRPRRATGASHQRVVAQHARGELLVGDRDPLAGRGCAGRVGERHVLDDAGVVLEADVVAEAQRLGDGEHQPGDDVGERLAGGEADDRRGDRARRQQRAADRRARASNFDSAIAIPTISTTA